jgi:2-polyprenylphenol hydroxylase and related flavodoxin oxidoreductases
VYKITSKKALTESIFSMDIEAPRVAKSAKPGQFIIIKNDEKGERIPLTIADYDAEKGTVTIVFAAIGKGTKQLAAFNEGDSVSDFVGPLGVPSEFIHEDLEELKKKKFIFIAGGVGAAPVYPQVKWMHENGIEVDVILGSRNKDLLIYEEELKAASGNLYVTTDDGSYGAKGTGSDMLKELVNNQGKKYDHAIIIGPMIMMKFTSMLTKELEIPTTVSLNPIMVDGTGMCGACRVTVGGEVKFACVDGPEFDGHLVNYDESMRRQAMYKTEEGKAILKIEEGDNHNHGGCGCKGDK